MNATDPSTHRSSRRRPPVVAAILLVVVALTLPPAVAVAASDPERSRQWPLDVIGADQGHAVGQGAGIVIAIVDSGVDLAHEDLAANLVAGIDIVDRNTSPQDEFRHGTHVAGIAAAVTGNGRGIAGVAPRASIMPVRVLDADGSGSGSDVNEGIVWAVDNGAHVVNLSLGRAAQQVFGSGFTEAVRYAWDNGVVVVVAAGNEFVLSSGFADEPAIVVSATTRDDRKPDYSNGVGSARWAMSAPGGGCQLVTCPLEDDVFSTYWVDDRPDTYAYSLGTSMAAPHVAGAAAVLLSLGLSPQQTVDRLLATAEDLGASGRDSTYGHGRLDLAAAVAGLEQSSSAPAGSPPAAPTNSQPSPAGQPPAQGTAPPAATAGQETQPGSSSPAATPGPQAAASSPTPAPGPPSVAPSTSATPPQDEDRPLAQPGTEAGTDRGALVALALILLAGAAVLLGGVVRERRQRAP